MAGAQIDGLDDLIGLGIECENCGRRRRLNRYQVQQLLGRGCRTVEQLGHKLRCRVCAEQGRVSKNVTIMPYYKSESANVVTPL